MKIFEVIATNLDAKDGNFVNALFEKQSDAIIHMLSELEGKQSKEIVEDIAGTLTEYGGRSLEWECCKSLPAVYHISRYGSYRCVVYVKPRKVN